MSSADLKLSVHTAKQPENTCEPPKQTPRKHPHIQKRLSFQERLLRNSLFACALLLGILSLSNLDAPWAQKAASGIEQALTMKIDLDESLGQLSFVQRIMPESALVFLNLSGTENQALPVEGSISHAYSEDQPWLMYNTIEGSTVFACAEGTIAAISPVSDGSYGILIDHGEGLESVTACLKDVCIAMGDKVARGTAIGTSGTSLYFELRSGDQACNPMEQFGL